MYYLDDAKRVDTLIDNRNIRIIRIHQRDIGYRKNSIILFKKDLFMLQHIRFHALGIHKLVCIKTIDYSLTI